MEKPSTAPVESDAAESTRLDVNVSKLSRPAIARIVEELENQPESSDGRNHYNRSYHRHNR